GTRINAILGPHSNRIEFDSLVAIPGYIPRNTIETLGHLYKIPARWREDLPVIEDLLFRQMRAFYASHRFGHPGEPVTAEVVYRSLKLLISIFRSERGRAPWAFVMMWWLALLNKEYIEPIVAGRRTRSPLYEVILSWELSVEESNERGVEIGGKIMDILP